MDPNDCISLDLQESIWDRVFVVAPLVLIGTREDGRFNLAPKHMATPLGSENYFGFVCTPRHRTYHNAIATGSFTVSYPTPEQVALAGLAASPRAGDTKRRLIEDLPTVPSPMVEGVFLDGAYLMLECEMDRVVDGIGANSLLVGRIVAGHVRRESLRVSEGDDQRLLADHPLLVYLHPGRYAAASETRAFPFPADFER